MSRTPLARLLADAERRPDPLAAFRIARRWFVAGRRIEMGELAAEVGVNRATLFRWVGGRDELLAEVVWSLTEPTLRRAEREASGRGGARIAAVLGRFAALVDGSGYFQAFLRREPERALRILTTRAGTLQARVVADIEAMLAAEPGLTLPLPRHDLAYLIVRITESFLYADLITGEDPDVRMVERAVAALLTSP